MKDTKLSDQTLHPFWVIFHSYTKYCVNPRFTLYNMVYYIINFGEVFTRNAYQKSLFIHLRYY